MYYNTILILHIFGMVLICTAQLNKNIKICEAKKTCGECIQISNCFWDLNSTNSHCDIIENINKSLEHINPKTEGTITDATATDHLNIRAIDLKIRIGKPYSFSFEYTHKKEYPVDIYFLMDMSISMQGYRSKISDLAAELYQTVTKKSKDVYFGFGSFIDKTTLPYASAVGNEIQQPCSQCSLPYSFKNHLKLSTNIAEFSNKVNNTQISANIDAPEGSLEALIQAIVCTEEIGWRKNARHLIILSTDDSFHVAGDGKLAGIVEPNDGECHLVNDDYTHGLLHDYPSIGQIRQKASEYGMNILYVVTPSQEILYRKLQGATKNSYLGTLQDNSDNIVSLVEDFYENLVSSVAITHNFDSNFNIKINSTKCPNFKDNVCENISSDATYDFKVIITLNSCPTDKKYNKNYFIKPNTLSEQINIAVEMYCDCPCEHKDHEDYKENSEKCSNSGELKCGVCICKPGKMGKKCQCNEEDINLGQQNVDGPSDCQKDNSSALCSSNGQCKCGTCKCNPSFSGTYCECNDNLCISNQNTKEVCSNHGQCECGNCKCNTDWSGRHCDCSTNTNTCIYRESNVECSGRGKCTCGKCVCDDKTNYGGDYCEECKTCPKSCSDFENCVKCHYSSDKCEERCTKYQIYDDTLENLNLTDDKLCKYQDDKCLIQFTLNYQNDGTAEIYAKRDCTITQAGIYSMLSFIILGILLLGMIILAIWKVSIELQYRREYAKFIEESNNPQWNAGGNPLFKKPVSEFQNPLYKKSN